MDDDWKCPRCSNYNYSISFCRKCQLSKSVYYKQENNKEIIFIEDDCNICLERLGYSYSILDCDHKYHKKCINKWLFQNKNSCPSCRQLIKDK